MTPDGQRFQFVTAAYLTRIEHQRAATIAELKQGMVHASDEAIFYHTFQCLGRYHFLTEEGFSNDFAQWVLAAANQNALAERLAAIDVRDYVSLADLRADIVAVLSEFIDAHPSEAAQSGFEPFHFLQAVEVALPLDWDARTLAEFRAGLERMSRASFFYHFISSRLRLQLRTNDFSYWFENSLGLGELASRVDRIDIYTNTLDSSRKELMGLVDQETAS
jgi:hypothetical protein